MKIDTNVALNLSIDIIHAYCEKDLARIQSHFDSRTFLVGPRNGQIWRSGEEILNAWIEDHPIPDFSVSDIEASSVLITFTACEVLLRYSVTWHRDDGTDIIHPQVMQVSWFLKDANSANAAGKDENYKIAVLHLSNPEELDERDLWYNTLGDIATSTIGRYVPSSGSREEEQWIIIHGIGSVLNRYPVGSILWIESANGGHKSLVHARDRSIRCVKQVAWFMEEYPGVFLQPSVSYIINPLYVKTVKRFQIELWNGKMLRVPEKKYYGFKKEFEKFFSV